MRWQRSSACRSICGLKSMSWMTTVSAPVKFKPWPPALVDSKHANIEVSLLNVSTIVCRSDTWVLLLEESLSNQSKKYWVKWTGISDKILAHLYSKPVKEANSIFSERMSLARVKRHCSQIREYSDREYNTIFFYKWEYNIILSQRSGTLALDPRMHINYDLQPKEQQTSDSF